MSIIVEFLINGVVLIKLSIRVLGRTSVTPQSRERVRGFNGYQETFYHKMETICMKLVTHKSVHFLVICKKWKVS